MIRPDAAGSPSFGAGGIDGGDDDAGTDDDGVGSCADVTVGVGALEAEVQLLQTSASRALIVDSTREVAHAFTRCDRDQ